MSSWSWRREDVPPLAEVIEKARRQRAGPPEDPRAVAYQQILTLARGMLFREIKSKRRREEVVDEFDARVARIEKTLSECKTFGEQLLSRERMLSDVNYARLDLRQRRPGNLPDADTLLADYDTTYSVVKRIVGKRRGYGIDKVVSDLLREFPGLSDDQAASAAYGKPSWGTCVVLGARYGVSPERVRDQRTAARRTRASSI